MSVPQNEATKIIQQSQSAGHTAGTQSLHHHFVNPYLLSNDNGMGHLCAPHPWHQHSCWNLEKTKYKGLFYTDFSNTIQFQQEQQKPADLRARRSDPPHLHYQQLNQFGKLKIAILTTYCSTKWLPEELIVCIYVCVCMYVYTSLSTFVITLE